MNILAILRAPQYSPNSEAKDRSILLAVERALRSAGHSVSVAAEDRLPGAADAWDAVFSMGRRPQTLAWLEQCRGLVVNTPEAVRRCARVTLQHTMLSIGTPLPPDVGTAGYWVKRGDACAQTPADVVFARDEAELRECLHDFDLRGILCRVVQAHVEGDLLKFYGVRGTGFFRCFYPTDEGYSKYGNEQVNGEARHYSFDMRALCGEAERLADAVSLDVYGGDAIVRADGSFCFIDFNDWPSFSRCREDAAEAIASLVEKHKKK